MTDWSQIGNVLDFCSVYFTTQLVRCAVFSFVLIGLVMLLRNIFFAKRTFVRGLLWSLFFLLPFLGRLKLFYENEMVLRATWRLTAGTMSIVWVDRIYMAGILTAAIFFFGRQLRLFRNVRAMKQMDFGHILIRVTDMNVTPFTVGLCKPKIVLSTCMVQEFSRDELEVIVRHELTHIRLGHLWCGFAWDILRCLMWINPFLTIFQKYVRADLEDLCDRVCIQNSGKSAHEYGMILLKSVKLLRSGYGDIPTAATYAGEKGFAQMKRRMGNIAAFCPYRKSRFLCMTAGMFFILVMTLLVIHTHSYGRYNEDKGLMVCQYDGTGAIVSNDTERLSRMISYDDTFVYIDREPFEDFLCQSGAEGEIYIYFGGFYKLPGLGSGAEACYYENDSDDAIVQIPYESIMDHWYVKLLQFL